MCLGKIGYVSGAQLRLRDDLNVQSVNALLSRFAIEFTVTTCISDDYVHAARQLFDAALMTSYSQTTESQPIRRLQHEQIA